MTSTRLSICAVALTVLSAATAAAAPAYVPSTVNLRTGAGTTNTIVTKIPGGSLVDVGACAEGWCEVDWQGKKGFAIETALDRSGRVPSRRPVARGPAVTGSVPVDPAPIITGPPIIVGGPVYYPGPYYYGYRPYGGYRRGWRRW